ncbi:MAG: FadR/GntR family transcriptional regulator [Mycobacterium sp.]
MPLVTTRRSGLVEQVIEQLRSSITSGEWPVGARIPKEAELTEGLGVGRNTVREAVRALAHAGILEVRQGDGTYVRATSEVSGALRRLCGSELREILQVRRALEVEGARLAAANRTTDELAELRALLAKSHEYLRSGADEFARADTDFHLAVVRCSHNTILIELYRGLLETIAAGVATATETLGGPLDHADLVEHIAAGDQHRAAQVVGTLVDHMLAGIDS